MINLTAYITVNTANNKMDRTTTHVGSISLIHTHAFQQILQHVVVVVSGMQLKIA